MKNPYVMSIGAKGRAQVAKAYLLNGKEFDRKFDTCFEMGDGDIVKLYLLEWARKNNVLAYAIRKTFNWPEMPKLQEVAQ